MNEFYFMGLDSWPRQHSMEVDTDHFSLRQEMPEEFTFVYGTNLGGQMESYIRWIALGVLAVTTAAVSAESPSIWPGSNWDAVDRAEVGMRVDSLNRARDYAISAGGSGMIVRHGKSVIRWGDQDQRYDIKSASKSVGVTALGLAIKDGLIRLEDRAASHHLQFGVPPDSNADRGWLNEITIRQLATQTAGFAKPGGYEKLLFKPGTHWHYSDGGPNWLAECVTLAYGRDVEDLLFERVFTPIGIGRDDLQWRSNQYRPHRIKDIPRREFGSGVHANVDALARIGYLYLHEGTWQDREILTKQFVRTATRPLESVADLPEWDGSHGNASDHYGLLWWNNADGTLERIPRDAFWAWGLYDSLIVVMPSLDLVAVRGGAPGRSWPRNKDENHYDVLAPFLEPIVEAAVHSPKEESK